MQIVLEHTRVINDRPGAGASESPSFCYTSCTLKMEAAVKRWKDEIDKKGEWFEYEVGNDGRFKAVKCRLCTKYEHKLKWCRNFSLLNLYSGSLRISFNTWHNCELEKWPMTELHRSCRFAMQTQILHCKMLSKVLRKICFAEQNNCYAKFQTAIHTCTCILHSTNCSAKKMTEFDPCKIVKKCVTLMLHNSKSIHARAAKLHTNKD